MLLALCRLITGDDAYAMIRNGTQVFVYVTDRNVNDSNLSSFRKAAKSVVVPSAALSCSEQYELCDSTNFKSLPQALVFNGRKRMTAFVGSWSPRNLKKFVYESGVFNVEPLADVLAAPNMREFLLLRQNGRTLPDSAYELGQQIHVFSVAGQYNASFEAAGYTDGGVRDIDVWLNVNGSVRKFDGEYSLYSVSNWLYQMRTADL